MVITPLAGSRIRRSSLSHGFRLPFYVIASYAVNNYLGTVEGSITAKKPAWAVLRRDALPIAVINDKTAPYAIVTVF